MKNEESTSILDQLDVHMVFATLVRFFPDAFMRSRTEGDRPAPALSLCGEASRSAVCLGSTKSLLYIPRTSSLISSKSDN